MKGIYWRPRHISRPALLVIAFIAVLGFICVELFPTRRTRGYYHEQLEAARLAVRAVEILKTERLKMNPGLDPASDPAQTGLIGPKFTPVTSGPGNLAAKQAALNPNFAAAVVHLLKEAGLKKGDTVAVGYTGSFPGLNIAVCAALETLHLKPVITSTASASEWGATDPRFLWLDMERILYERGVISFRSEAASVGGIDDRGGGFSPEGRKMLIAGISRNGIHMLEPINFKESITLHMRLYHAHTPLKAYINVGGGRTSIGTRGEREVFKTGLNRHLPLKKKMHDSVTSRFLAQDVPVIHLLNVDKLARHYGLSLKFTTLPAAGEGDVYSLQRYNPWLAGGVLLLILACLYAFFRSDWGFRILQTAGRQEEQEPPEPMV